MSYKSKKKISVIGAGYVGLPISLVLSKNHKVTVYDKNINKIKKISKSEIFQELKFKNLYSQNINKSIFFSAKFKAHDYNFICASSENKFKSRSSETDLAFKIILDIINQREKNKSLTYIILMSTTQIGFADRVNKFLKMRKLDKKIKYIYTPERIFPSDLYRELIMNDKVIGCNDKHDFSKILKIFKTFCKGKIVMTNHKTAESIKIVENTYRNINIAYANELLRVAIKEKIEINKIITLANQHPRVNILSPGLGVGGHCIPVDPLFLTDKYKNIPLIRNSIKTNNDQIIYFTRKIISFISKKSMNKILIMGLSYKSNIGDFRNSPSLLLAKNLNIKDNFKTYITDPYINKSNLPDKTDFNLIKTINLSYYDLVILTVYHDLYKNLNFKNCNYFIDLSGKFSYENINNL